MNKDKWDFARLALLWAWHGYNTAELTTMLDSAVWVPPPFMASVSRLLTTIYEADRYLCKWQIELKKLLHTAACWSCSEHNRFTVFPSSVIVISTDRTIWCCKTGGFSMLQYISLPNVKPCCKIKSISPSRCCHNLRQILKGSKAGLISTPLFPSQKRR